MEAEYLINTLQEQGVSLWIEENNIRYKGPSHVMTTDVLQLLKSNKQEIINIKKAIGFGCAQCGSQFYQTVQQYQSYYIPELDTFKDELQDCWQCEVCNAVYLYIGGTKGPSAGKQAQRHPRSE